jgi:hypothetical protein
MEMQVEENPNCFNHGICLHGKMALLFLTPPSLAEAAKK